VGFSQYDPYRPLDAESTKKPVDIQVIAEPYKWVFVYPEQQIATINELRFPEQTPVHFHITSDFTMNSFFMPQLAGQIYAMAGMQTHLHVLANETGVYRGFSSNYSGYGFSQMHFKAHSVTKRTLTNGLLTLKQVMVANMRQFKNKLWTLQAYKQYVMVNVLNTKLKLC
jgi:cytochrome o ubiquinol oxidase subunit 2